LRCEVIAIKIEGEVVGELLGLEHESQPKSSLDHGVLEGESSVSGLSEYSQGLLG